MLRRIGVAAATLSAVLAASGTAAAAAPATSSNLDGSGTGQACELVLSPYLAYSALTYGWSTGLNGCAGEVETAVETAPGPDGPWSGDGHLAHYDDEVRSTWVYEGDFPCGHVRVRSTFESQTKVTAPVFNPASDSC